MDLKVEDGAKEADKGLGWGKSLPVPSVHGIVRNDSECVPERFIQEQQDRPNDSPFCPNMFDEIPVIDCSSVANGDEDELNKLNFAGKILNHGVPEEVSRNVKAAAAAFFNLPMEE